MHTPLSHFKIILPGIYLTLVLLCLLATVPSIFTNSLSYCSGSSSPICLPYGIIGLIFLHLPLALVLQPLINFIDAQNIYPSLAVLFFGLFLANLLVTLLVGAILDLIFFRKNPPPPESTVTNPLRASQSTL